jgi:hypothetical protein
MPKILDRLPVLARDDTVTVRLAVDGQREHVMLRTPDWRTRLLRWLT